MNRIGRALAPFALAALLGFQAFGPPPTVPDPGYDIAADTTLADTVAAGAVLIRLLPDSVRGEPVSSYRAIVVPARGWLVERSFFWRVPSDARGPYTFLFEARRRSAADSVRLQVTVTEPSW